MSQVLRIGIVGCGRVVEYGYIPALRRIRGARVVGVADPVLERCHRIAPGVPAYSSAKDLLLAGGVDAVVLATPASAHLADARLTAAAGLPTLIEKPPAVNLEEAMAIAALSKRSWLGFNRRFDPPVQRIRASIREEAFVDLVLERYHPGSWKPYVVRDDMLMSIGPHNFDLVRWLTGSEITRVRALEIGARSVSLEVGLERGRARVRFGYDSRWVDSIEARDTDGNLIARHGTASFVQRVARRIALRGANSLAQLLIREVEEFVRAARGRPAPVLATAADGVPVMAAVDAARRSGADGGRWYPVALTSISAEE